MARQVHQRCLRRVLERPRSVQGRFRVHQGPHVTERRALQEKVRWLLGDDSLAEVFIFACGGLCVVGPEYQDVASRFPVVPAMVSGPAVHATMERPSRGPAEAADWAQWWPHLINPWNMSASTPNRICACLPARLLACSPSRRLAFSNSRINNQQ